jgi:hypothetical protein
VQHGLDHDGIRLGEQRRGQAGQPVAERPRPRALPVLPGPDHRGETPGAHVGRGQDGAGRAEREQRRRERIVPAQHREPVRRVSQEPDRVLVDAAHGVLDPGDPGQLGQPPQGLPAHRLAGPVRDVVDDQRHRAGRGELREVGHHARLGRAGVVRHDDQRGRHFGPGGQLAQRPRRRLGVVRTGPRDNRAITLLAHPSNDVEHAAPLRPGERGRLAGGAERHQPGCAVVEHGVGQSLQRVGSESAVGGKRRDERDVQAGQRLIHAPRLTRPSYLGPVHVSSLTHKLN